MKMLVSSFKLTNNFLGKIICYFCGNQILRGINLFKKLDGYSFETSDWMNFRLRKGEKTSF